MTIDELRQRAEKNEKERLELIKDVKDLLNSPYYVGDVKKINSIDGSFLRNLFSGTTILEGMSSRRIANVLGKL